MYGWAWALKLVTELHDWDYAEAKIGGTISGLWEL
jgi:hypothetical protein